MTALRILVVASLRKNGPATVSEVFDDLHGSHSKNSIGMCLARLADRGAILKKGTVQPEIGRPAVVFGVKG